MKLELKKLLVLNLPYLLFVYLFAKCGQAYRLAAGADASAKLLHLTSGISAAFANPLPSLHPFDLCVGVAGAVAVRLIVYSKGKNAKKYRKGEEYGSARWGTAKDIAPYIDPKFENNILLTQTERLTMTGRPKDPKTARNKNVLVIGGSGSGKTRFYVKPNLMQCFPTSDYPTSFVVTDPKGTLVLETGQMFQRAGYRVKILNTINFSKSMKYNPFVYIHSEKDVLKLVNTLIANTKGEGEKSAEDFWVKSERLFYTALIGYIWYEAPAEEMNFTTLLEMINASEAREDDPEFQSPVDLMFERLEQKDPDHFAVRQYKKFLLSAGKTRSSILISCGARLAPFDIREVRELMEDDEMELDTIGDEKTVLFLIMSDTDTTFNFILAMLQSQLINCCVTVRMINTAVAACPCTADSGRVRQHRADSQLRQADRHHPQPGNLGIHHLAEPVTAKSHLQGCGRNHFGQLRFCSLFEWAGQKCQRDLRCAGERDHRQFQHQREPGFSNLPRNELSKIRKGVDVRGRNRNHGRRQMYFAAAGCEAVLLGEVRHHQAPALQIPCGRGQEKHL